MEEEEEEGGMPIYTAARPEDPKLLSIVVPET